MTVLFRVELYVKDIEKSLAFYQDFVGLQLYGRNERCGRFNYDFFSLLITSDATLDGDHYFKRSKSDLKGNGMELIIVVKDLEIVYQRCLENNYVIKVPIEKYDWGMRGFKIIDPDGYFLRITSE